MRLAAGFVLAAALLSSAAEFIVTSLYNVSEIQVPPINDVMLVCKTQPQSSKFYFGNYRTWWIEEGLLFIFFENRLRLSEDVFELESPYDYESRCDLAIRFDESTFDVDSFFEKLFDREDELKIDIGVLAEDGTITSIESWLVEHRLIRPPEDK